MNRSWCVIAAVIVLLASGCSPSGEVKPLFAPLMEEALARKHLTRYVQEQRLEDGFVRLIPSDHDWTFLRPVLRASATVDSRGVMSAAPTHPAMTIAYGRIPAGMRRCLSLEPYAVLVADYESCPGDWIAYRADDRSSGTSTFRLNWPGAPREVLSFPLEIEESLDPLRLLAHDDPRLGQRLYVNNGTSLEAFDRTARKLWSVPGVGIGEIIDVVDLDGDGENEIVFSPGSRWNSLNPSGAGPAQLIVLAARNGEILWRYQFTGIEFGLNRRRTSIVPSETGSGRSIYAVMTYSPHLWRFDFSAGARHGELRWKSEPVAYASPDKPPLVADFDGDGLPEAVIDSMGTLYAIRLSDGALLHALTYAPFHSFGGFAQAVDLDGDGRLEIIGMSNSMYMKNAFVARYSRDGFSIVWRKEWEHGLDTTTYELRAEPGVLRPNGSERHFLLWSTRDLTNAEEQHVTDLVDALTGITVDRVDAAYLALLGDAGGNLRLVATRGGGSMSTLAVEAGGFGAETVFHASRWHGVSTRLRPSLVADTSRRPSFALYSDAAGTLSSLTVGPGGVPSSQTLGSDLGLRAEPLQSFDGVNVHLGLGYRGRVLRAEPFKTFAEWGTYSPRLFAAPITADLDGDGRREIVVPFRKGTGIARFHSGAAPRVQQIVASSPAQQRESFHVPVIAWDRATGTRVAVAFHSVPLGFSANTATGERLWAWSLPPANWEPSLVIGRHVDGTQTVFYNDSRLTAAIRPGTGELLWTHLTAGQCQRQIASIDWNGDGVADVALQSADIIAILDGNSGSPLATILARSTYGGYVTAAGTRAATITPVVSVHGIGGVTVVDSQRGVMLDAAFDERLVESIPKVVGRRGEKGEYALFQISGAGRLRVLSLEGTTLAEQDLDVPALTMTGAYVDDDEVVDLLVSTYQGELLAVSGASLEVLWRLQLEGVPGPAVATDIDGDGVGEVVVITSDGQLRVLRPPG